MDARPNIYNACILLHDKQLGFSGQMFNCSIQGGDLTFKLVDEAYVGRGVGTIVYVF